MAPLAVQIDVGGDEVPAVGGALGTLGDGRMGVVALAYGGDGAWREGWLGQVVVRMDELGHTCYLAGGWASGGAGIWLVAGRSYVGVGVMGDALG
jgi:hypothetical protein